MERTMLEYLERDKDRLTADLSRSENMESAVPVLEQELDRILVQYNENCDIPAVREQAAQMIQAARISLPLVDSTGETKVWEEKQALSAETVQRSGKQAVLIGGAVAGAALSWGLGLIPAEGVRLLTTGPWSLICLAVSLCCTYLAGRSTLPGTVPYSKKGLFGRKRYETAANRQDAGQAKMRTQVLPDPEHIYRSLKAVVVLIDRNLETAAGRERWQRQRGLSGNDPALQDGTGTPDSPDEKELDLFADLLEAACSKDGSYALDKAAQVEHYLHSRGIEARMYEADLPQEWFDHMPSASDEPVTIRPALIRDGAVIRRGLVSG